MTKFIRPFATVGRYSCLTRSKKARLNALRRPMICVKSIHHSRERLCPGEDRTEKANVYAKE